MSDADVLDTIFECTTAYPQHDEASAVVDDESRKEELQAVQLAENGHLEDALSRLTQLTEKQQDYWSAYNNRAQVYRLMNKPSLAMEDLDLVIAKCDSSEVLQQAYTQRALLRKEAGSADSAYQDMCAAARHGQPIAKEIAVFENPHRKLCHAMVHQVLKQEMNK